MPGFISWYPSATGLKIPSISSSLTFADTFGSWKSRWGIGRMGYIVPPGLYAIGLPDDKSPVIVTANYKMSYDIVRKALAGRSVWLMVLETYGINVWCAAGKGTFGTGELVKRVDRTRLAEVVSHRQLIVPLLGAAGVKAIEVQKRSGFRVRFATIRAEDLPGFLDQEAASAESRELTFTPMERLVLTPIEIVSGLGKSLPILLLLFVAGLFHTPEVTLDGGVTAVSAYLLALVTGAFIAPLLLPFLPSRSFALKGGFAGLVIGSLFCYLAGIHSPMSYVPAILMISAVSSFLTLNFTGSTPYTSRSGVKKEMKWALPIQSLALLAGGILCMIERFM